MIVEYGQLTNSFHTEAIIIRKEKVYKSPVTGKITYSAKNSHRISGGQLVAKIRTDNQSVSIFSREAGILSYSYDKLEDELSPANINEISLKKFNNIENNYKNNKNNNSVNENKPFYRIVNNSDLYALVKIDETKAERFWIKETIFLKDDLKDDSKLIEAKINNIINYGDESFLIVEFKRFIDKWLNTRKKEIELIKNIHEGLIVPNSAILPTSDGYKVVVVDSRNNYNSKNIEIIFSDEQYTIIEGLELGDEILINPAKSNY